MGCIAEMGPGECQQLFFSAGGVSMATVSRRPKSAGW
jgi:hypothetical protein